jgi:hypothetical protein
VADPARPLAPRLVHLVHALKVAMARQGILFSTYATLRGESSWVRRGPATMWWEA